MRFLAANIYTHTHTHTTTKNYVDDHNSPSGFFQNPLANILTTIMELLTIFIVIVYQGSIELPPKTKNHYAAGKKLRSINWNYILKEPSRNVHGKHSTNKN